MTHAERNGGPDVVLPRIHRLFAEPLATRPDAEALVGPHRRYTYRELESAANAAGRFFVSLGTRPGDRIAAALPNSTDIVVAFHGAMRASAVWVGINPRLTVPEIAYMLEDSAASVVLCDTRLRDALEQIKGDLPDLRHLVTIDETSDAREWRGALSKTESDSLNRQVSATEPAGIAYTSGTTGFPKGVVHSERNLLLVGRALVDTRGYGPDLRKGDSLSFSILNVIVLSTLLCAQAQGCCIVTDVTEPSALAEWLIEERVGVWNGVPALLHKFLDDPSVGADTFAGLREVWTGGGDCPDELNSAFAAQFGTELTTTYGLTEAPAVATISPVGSPFVSGSSGIPLPHIELTIRDSAGRVVPDGDEGEICVGPAVDGPFASLASTMIGYWRKPSATEEVLRGGVVHTGDVGNLGARGELYVRGRLTSMIVRGGTNVYPAEVERVLQAHPNVRGCAVFGLPDQRLGEVVAAVVETWPEATFDEDEIRVYCRRSLAGYKVPQVLIQVGELPRNAMGKVIRSQMRQLAEQQGWTPTAGK